MLSIGYNAFHCLGGVKSLFRQKWVWVILYAFVLLYSFFIFTNTKETIVIPVGASSQPNVQSSDENPTVSVSSFNLFGQPVPKATELRHVDWKLEGIIIHDSDRGVAIIELDNATKSLKVGDRINATTKIHRIEKDKIIVLDDGQLKMLKLFKTDPISSSSRLNITHQKK